MAASYLEMRICYQVSRLITIQENLGTHKKSSTFQIHVHVILSTETLACIYLSASVSRPIFGETQATKDR